MCNSLEDRMRDLQRWLAGAILRRAQGGGGGPEQDKEGTDGHARDLAAPARELIPDDHPLRQRIEAHLAQLRARDPISPSEMFVIVEDQQRLLEEVLGSTA
jgi:hypothetical protein